MTAVHEPIPAASIPAITYRQAVDLIVAASDALTLPFPYGIDEVPGTGILSVSFWTDLDVQSWTDFFGASAWDGARRKVIVHAHDWHGWTVQMTGQGMPSLVCPKCNGGYAHQLGCDDDPTVYVPVAMPTGDTANRDECARLYDEHHRLTTADVDGPVTPGPLVERDDNAVMAKLLPGPDGLPRDVALEFSHHRGFNGKHRVRIDTEGLVWLDAGVRGWAKVGEVALADIRVAEIDAHCIVENYLNRPGYASDQYLYADAPERIQTQRDDETFAQIVGPVTL